MTRPKRRRPQPDPVPPEPAVSPPAVPPIDDTFTEEGPADQAAPLAEPQEPLLQQEPPLVPVSRFPSRRKIRPWVWWALGTVGTLAALCAALWFLLPIKTVEVTGNHHLAPSEVKQLAGLGGQVGWLFYGKRQANGLLGSPWVKSATVIRHFPDTVLLNIVERQPVLKVVQPSGAVKAVAEDGHILPGAGDLSALPTVSGWGPDRLADAALIVRALSRYTVQSVAYTPSGLKVVTAGGTVWSGDLKSIVKYAGSISMYPNKTINIYPWGVSVQQ